MSNKIVYISDFFADQVLGGAELNDKELVNILKSADCLDILETYNMSKL